MSIASAFNSAGSGLNAATRLADTVSSNVANAMTPGYARRSTELGALAVIGMGNGVKVIGTHRAENAQLTAERRVMQATAGAAATRGDALDRVMAAVGVPGSPAALASRATALETALMAAAAAPSSVNKLAEVAGAASSLARALNTASMEITEMRFAADAAIERQVDTLNRSLHEIQGLNRKIADARVQGIDTASLEDQRGRVIDGIAEIVPLRTVKREDGAIAIYTAQGGALLDGRVWALDFATTGDGSGGLGQWRGGAGDPVPVPVGAGGGLFDGGSLAALFEVRDTITTEALAELDAYASNLMARFTLAPPEGTMPPEALSPEGEGLFVDRAGGGVAGLAGRIALNGLVDPALGGDLRLLRDGLDGTERPNAFGDFLQAMGEAMTLRLAPPDGMLSAASAGTAAGLAAELSAFFGGQLARADEARAFATAQAAILAERELDMTGVDTDAELQFLMLVEQAYAANARVLSVVDSLLRQILEIGR